MNWIIYIIYRAVTRGIARLPVVAVFRLGAVIGWAAGWLLVPYRRLVIENLTLAFGGEKSPKEIRKLARRHFTRLGANLLSSIKLASMPGEEILRHVKIEGLELLKESVAQPPGAVFMASHLGNWEVLGQMAPLTFPCPCGTIYQRLGNPFIDAEVRAMRARLGLQPFERKEGFLKAIALAREGGAVGVLVDQHAGDAGIWCPFFGRLASTSPLAATLALRTEATLLATAVYVEKPGYWRMVIEKPTLSGHRDAEVMTAEINLFLEQQIRRAPEDWFWVHNRWKTPRPNLLLAQYKRGIVFPPGFDSAQLKPFNIVVRASNWLGDAVMMTPAVQAIKAGRPDVRLTVLTKAKLADYWKRVPEVDAILTIEPSDSVFSVARKLRGKFDVAVVFPNSIRSALEAWLAGVPRRIGYPAQWRSRLLNQPFVPPKQKKNAPPQPARHQVYHYLALARSMGAATGDLKEADFFKTARPSRAAIAFAKRNFRNKNASTADRGQGMSAADVAAALHPKRNDAAPRAVLPHFFSERTFGRCSNAPIKIGLCPGAEYGPAKRWLPERFAEVARTVASRVRDEYQTGCEWLLFGVAGDAPIGDAISAHLNGECTNLIGKTTLAELMDRLSECQLLLTNDTGTMHLAAFLGVPTVALFGSTEPQLTGPLGSGHRVLRHQVECSPCFLRDCPLDFRCMNAVTAEETIEAIMGMIRSNTSGSTPR